MYRHRSMLALLLGTGLGFSLAVATGVLAAREPPRAAPESHLLAEVLERVKQDYVDPVDDRRLMQLTARGMVAGLDPHSSLLDATEVEDLRAAAEGVYTGIGVEISVRDSAIKVIAAVEDSPADRAGLRSGDLLIAIDGRELRVADLTEAVARLRGNEGTLVNLTVERDGADEPLRFSVRRARVGLHSVRSGLLESGVGYVRIRHFSDRTADELRDAVVRMTTANGAPLRGLVLDLRDNPGGSLDAATRAADLFLDHGIIVNATGRAPGARFTVMARPGDILNGAPVAVLVNGGSASAAEIVAGALRDHGRAVLLGRTTFGKGSVQTVLPLSDGHALKLTTSRYYTPSGASIHERGIRPDVVLARTVVPLPDPDDPSRRVDGDAEVQAAFVAVTDGANRDAGVALADR